MKRQALMILTTLSLFVMLTATAVYSQSDTRLKVMIPFEFFIGTRALPAGEYAVIYKSAGVVQVQNRNGGESVFVPTGPVEANKTRNELVFNRYGDQYFLSTLWTEGNQFGRAVRLSRSEREFIRARIAWVTSASEPQTVSIVPIDHKR